MRLQSMAFLRPISMKLFHFSSRFMGKNLFSSFPVLSSSEDAVVSAAVSILKHHRSKSRWSNLRPLLAGKNHGLTSGQFSVIVLQIRNKAHLCFSFFNFTLLHSLCSHTLFSYATVIHILSRSRLKSQAQTLIKNALRVFSEAHQEDSSSPVALFEALVKTYRVCDSAPFVFDLLVKACIESKKIDAAVELYKMLKSKNLCLRTSTCNSLIELVSKGRDSFVGYDLCRDMFCFDDIVGRIGYNGKSCIPTATTFNIVMVGFYREGVVEKVEEVWGEMERQCCLPNAYSYNVLMAVYCDDKRMVEAMQVWKQMEDKGFKHDTMAYNTIIGGFCGVGDVVKAKEMYREMATNGLEYTPTTYEHLINLYCGTGDTESAILLYEDMRRKDFSPENSTVNVIIRTLCDKDKVSAAMKFLRSEDVILDKESYVRLTRGLCQEGMMEDALKLQANMVRNGFEPDSEIYGAFIDGYMKQGNEAMACKLKREYMTSK